MFERILGSLGQIRVRVHRRSRENDERRREKYGEERETKKKNEANRTFSFYIGAGPGRFGPDPAPYVLGH